MTLHEAIIAALTATTDAEVGGEPVTEVYKPEGLAVLATNAVNKWLRDPDNWSALSDGWDHPYEYDLSDSSERMDVVQIVCQRIASAPYNGSSSGEGSGH